MTSPKDTKPSPVGRRKARRGGGLTLSVVLVVLAVSALFIGGTIRELKSSRRQAADSARYAAYLLTEQLIEEPTLSFAPGDTGSVRIRSVLEQYAPEDGAVFLVPSDEGIILSAGRIRGLQYDPAWLRGKPEPGNRMAIRVIPNGATIVTVAPAAPPVSVLLPYGLMAILLAAGTAIILRRAQRFAEEADAFRLRSERAQDREQILEEAGIGLWSVKSGLVTLPASLRSRLGFASIDLKVHLDEIGALFDDMDAPRARAFFSGKIDRRDGRFLMLDAAGERRSAYFSLLGDAPNLWGSALMISDQALDDGRSLQLIQRLHETLEAIPQAFLHWDAFGRLVAWNDQFRVIFNVRADDLKQGMSVDEVAASIGVDQRYLYTYFAPPTSPRAEEEALFPDDRCLRIVRKRTIGDGWVCIGHDITDAKADADARARKERELQMTVNILQQSRKELSDLNEQYAIQRQRAEDANRAKTEFLANISHELRTPLNAINGFSALMQSELYGPLGSEKYEEYVGDILESGQHLLALIDDILDLSKVEAGKMQLRINQFDLEKVLEESIRVIETQARQANINLLAAFDHLPSVIGDARAVKQVILNLLTNAVKFTENGGRVTVTTVSDLESVTVIVADTGAGLEEENLRRLGTPFMTFGSSQKRDQRGTGLGLALSKSLVEAMDGILCMASEKNRGTVAAFTLPRRKGVLVQLPDILEGKVHVLTKTKASNAQSDVPNLPFAAE